MHHFGSYRNAVRTCIAGCALWFLLCGAASARGEAPTLETRLGVADVQRILRNYWRTRRVKAEVERYKKSEALRQKQPEAAELDRELTGQRFWFLRGRRATEKNQEKRNLLRTMEEEEAERVREKEKEATEELLSDIRKASETIGRQQQLTVIFDSNTPHILFLNTFAAETNDVTDAVIENLNWR